EADIGHVMSESPLGSIEAAPVEKSATLSTVVDKPVSVPEGITTYRIKFDCTNIARPVMEKLLADLSRQGQLKNLTEPGNETVCILQFSTRISEEDVWESLIFLVDPAGLSIEIAEKIAADPPPEPVVECEQEHPLAID